MTPCPLCEGELDPEPETELVRPVQTDRHPEGQRVECRRCGTVFIATGPHRSRPVKPSRN